MGYNRSVSIQPDTCYDALAARDPRFDGLFFVGVATTGIYCRPVCTARTPGRDRCSFYRTAVAAERAGFRACFVCRPELAPGTGDTPPVDAIARLVARATRWIDEGFLNNGTVDALASGLGVSARHLRRAMEQTLGVSPVQLAQSRRLALAKRLLQDTHLRHADIAFAAGFGSVRRFNAAFAKRFARTPRDVRGEPSGAADTGPLTLRLDYRPPYDWPHMLAFLAPRATPGVERVDGDTYLRVVSLDGASGVIRIRPHGRRDALQVEVSAPLIGSLMRLVARLRRQLDLDARPDVIVGCLSRDRLLAPALARRPGLRVPGGFDACETAVRAVLGQQVSVRGATTVAGRLVQRFGAPLAAPADGLTHRFPEAGVLAAADPAEIASLGMPRARAETVRAIAGAMAGVEDADDPISRLREIRGVGDWTAQYVAMRALRDPDAFPAGDLVIRRVLGGVTTAAARRMSARWRPWRAYAALALWAGAGAGDPDP